MDVLQKARELAKTNPYLKTTLETPAKQRTRNYQKKKQALSHQMKKLEEIYQEEHTSPFILMNPSHPSQPLKLPPSKHTISTTTTEQHIMEQKEMLERLSPTTSTQATTGKRKGSSATPRRKGRPQKRPTLKYFQELEQKHQTHQTEQKQTYQRADNTIEATATTPTGASASSSISADVVEADVKTSTASAANSPLTNTKSFTNTNTTTQKKKVSKIEKLSPDLTRAEKALSPVPIIYGARQITEKNTLNLLQIYSQNLTSEQVEMMLEYRAELELTHAEEMALNLLKATKTDENAKKQYWKIQETLERSRKQLTPVKASNSTLLDQKLAAAEEAIFGEIIEKPVDK